MFLVVADVTSAVKSYLSGNSMSSMVSGSGTPLVSGSRRTKPPARNAKHPAENTLNTKKMLFSSSDVDYIEPWGNSRIFFYHNLRYISATETSLVFQRYSFNQFFPL